MAGAASGKPVGFVRMFSTIARTEGLPALQKGLVSDINNNKKEWEKKTLNLTLPCARWQLSLFMLTCLSVLITLCIDWKGAVIVTRDILFINTTVGVRKTIKRGSARVCVCVRVCVVLWCK